MLNEKSIKKQIEFDDKKIWAFVNYGTHTENYELEPGTEVLVLVVVCHQNY